MKKSVIYERVDRVLATRGHADAPVDSLKAALADVRGLRSFLTAAEADLARRLRELASFPEADLAESSKGSLHDATKTLARAETLGQVPGLADALERAVVTAGHVDAVTKAAKGLDDHEQRQELFDRVDSLVDVAAAADVAQFGKRVRDEASRIASRAGVDRLERQVKATSLSTWVDGEGMWNLRGKFDPLTGLKLAAKLDGSVEALFHGADGEIPDSCPTDPLAKQQHLRALALARLVEGSAGSGRAGRPEFVAVIDVAAGAGSDPAAVTETSPGGPADIATGADHWTRVSWPIPIEVPTRVLEALIDDADITAVVVRNGVVLHAPGELNLGRTTRLANRAQRRALRGLYATCAIPGCSVGYDRCKLHHIIWWRHGGRTDLDNLLPVCSHHHHKIHDAGWHVELGPNRELAVAMPDGTIRNTGPPRRLAA